MGKWADAEEAKRGHRFISRHAKLLGADEKRLLKRLKALREECKQLGMKRHHLLRNSGGKATITEQQAKAILLLIDFEANYPPEYIAEQCGVAVRTYHTWRNDPVFMKELDHQITIRKSRLRLEAWRQVFKKIRAGNPKILLKYLEMLGDLKKNVVVEEAEAEVLGDEDDIDAELTKLKQELGIAESSSVN